MRRLTLALALALGTLAPGVADDGGKVRGITVSTHTDGREWGHDVIGPTLEEIRDVGAGWVSTHPYAGVRSDGTIVFRDFDPENPPAHLVRPIREAHRLGLKIMIKPHLAYWGSGFAWRGDIIFDDEAAWQRFWEGYERWISKVARACREADGFVVGTELDRTLGHERQWRRIVGRVREATDAALTYAANWSDYERVGFWDALDVIGIQAYFPLSEARGAARIELEAGWARRMELLREYAARHRRKVVFTELGYNRSFDAAVRPWESRVDGPEAERFQAICLEVALRAVEAEPVVVGAFLWKWFPQPYPIGRTFQLATPRLREVIAGVWGSAGLSP